MRFTCVKEGVDKCHTSFHWGLAITCWSNYVNFQISKKTLHELSF